MNFLEDNEIKSFKLNILISLVCELIILVLSILNLISYLCLLTFALGVIASMVCYYHTARTINLTNYVYLKKTTTRLFAIRMLIYALVMIVSYLISNSIVAFLLSALGILILKAALFITNFKRNKDGKD